MLVLMATAIATASVNHKRSCCYVALPETRQRPHKKSPFRSRLAVDSLPPTLETVLTIFPAMVWLQDFGFAVLAQAKLQH